MLEPLQWLQLQKQNVQVSELTHDGLVQLAHRCYTFITYIYIMPVLSSESMISMVTVNSTLPPNKLNVFL